MAIMVKDLAGIEHEVASNGKANAALTTGIIGTALGGLLALGGGMGLLGGNAVVDGNISKDMYYRDMINQINITNAQFAEVNSKICGLGERIAVGETANYYQNRITDIGFANVDSRFATERLVTDYEIGARTCHFIKGNVYLSPSNLADNYYSPTRVLDSHEPRFLDARRGYCGGEAFYGDCAPCGR